MNILVTGGLGFIGSITCIQLFKANHNFIIVDNLSNSNIGILEKIKNITNKNFKYYNLDLKNENDVEKIFLENKIDGIIHFAALKAVGESVKEPIKYYENNIISTLNLAKLCIKYNVNRFIYSSSATVYGEQKPPLFEYMPLQEATNSYGQTKIICEKILTDIANANKNFKVTFLRYANPIGADETHTLGENPNGIPQNISPYIVKVILKKLPVLNVFGNDYDTVDGSGVRDYIHVLDLANAHILALEKMINQINIYNVGTGNPTSVFELIKTFEKVSNSSVEYKIVERREGDVAISYLNSDKIYNELGFKPKYNIEDMCRDLFLFAKNNY